MVAGIVNDEFLLLIPYDFINNNIISKHIFLNYDTYKNQVNKILPSPVSFQHMF